MKTDHKITLDRLKELLSYEPITGIFRWRFGHPRTRLSAGAEAGTVSSRGYLDIKIDQAVFRAHRLAWLYMTGKWPVNTIDHADRNKLNNRFSNLREATLSQNLANRVGWLKRDLPKGVARTANGKRFCASIHSGNIRKRLGTFDTVEEASSAYLSAAKKIYGEFAL